MQNIYELIKTHQQKGACLLATITEGEDAGKKILLCDGQIVPGQDTDAFPSRLIPGLNCIHESGMVTLDGCQIFCEALSVTPHLVVCGAGTVGLSVIPLAKTVGFYVTALEDRPEYAGRAKEVGSDEVLLGEFEDSLQNLKTSSDTYFVVVTREHSYDIQCLRRILTKEIGYAGMMGSHKRAAIIKKQLKEEGIGENQLQKLQAPIGEEILAQTPEEIAVSIVAQLIRVKNEKRRTLGYTKDLLNILTEQTKQPLVLAMIVDRKGSTPRDIGTKMLVRADGTHVGTVGGGIMEAEVLSLAVKMLEDPKGARTEINRDNVLPKDQMLCGGTQTVYLEKIL